MNGVVFYCDGAAKPNPGFIGWGAHGYLYRISNDASTEISSVGAYVATANGYIEKKVSSAKPVEVICKFNYLGTYTADKSTNNVAEIRAVYETLKRIPMLPGSSVDIKQIQIITDSKYLIDALRYLPTWRKNQWRTSTGSQVANKDLLVELDEYLTKLKEAVEVKISHIMGHTGLPGNTEADALAVKARLMTAGGHYLQHEFNIEEVGGDRADTPLVDGVEVPTKPTKKAKTPKAPPVRPPLLFTRTLYFNGWTGSETTGVYYLNVLSKDNETAGKPSPGSGFAVAVLDVSCPYIELVKGVQQSMFPEAYVINSMALDTLYKPTTLESIDISKQNAFTVNARDFSLLTDGDLVLTKAENPVGLSIRAMELMTLLKQYSDVFILKVRGDDYSKALNDHDLHDVDVVEITDEFFIEVKNKPTLKPELDTSVKRVVLKKEIATSLGIVPLTFPLQFNLNLPSRNAMKRMEGLDCKVYLLTFSESPLSIRYFIGITTSVGYMLLSNYHADKIYLTDGVSHAGVN